MNKEYYKELIEGIEVPNGSLYVHSIGERRLAEEVLRGNGYTTTRVNSTRPYVLDFSRENSEEEKK